MVALLSLTEQKVQISHPYHRSAANLVFACCVNYGANLECSARVAKTLNVVPDQLVREAELWQQALRRRSAMSGKVEILAAVTAIGCDVLKSPRGSLTYRCAACRLLKHGIPASIIDRCKVFCLGAMSKWRHLLFSLAKVFEMHDSPPVIFRDDDEEEAWEYIEDMGLDTFCDDSDSMTTKEKKLPKANMICQTSTRHSSSLYPYI